MTLVLGMVAGALIMVFGVVVGAALVMGSQPEKPTETTIEL